MTEDVIRRSEELYKQKMEDRARRRAERAKEKAARDLVEKLEEMYKAL